MKKYLLALCLVLLVGASTANAGPIMFVDDASGNLGTVDVATGAVTVIGNMGVTMTDIAFDPFGNLFGISFTNLYSINLATAAATDIGALGLNGANALVFNTSGVLYTAAFNSTDLYTVNTGTGAATSLGDMGFASAGDLAFNSGNLYLAATTNELVNVNLGSLALTSAVGSFGVSGVFGLASGSDGVLYAVAGTNVYTVNTGTGAATNPVSFAGQGLGTANGESFFDEAGATSVPEPSSILLLGSGVALAAIMKRRSRRT